jgi:hypothetical protein
MVRDDEPVTRFSLALTSFVEPLDQRKECCRALGAFDGLLALPMGVSSGVELFERPGRLGVALLAFGEGARLVERMGGPLRGFVCCRSAGPCREQRRIGRLPEGGDGFCKVRRCRVAGCRISDGAACGLLDPREQASKVALVTCESTLAGPSVVDEPLLYPHEAARLEERLEDIMAIL